MSRKKTTALRFFKAPARAAAAAPRELTLAIEKLSAEGRGMGFEAGKPVFVAGALPGERVRARIHTQKREFAEAQLLEVLDAVPQRETPRCAVFGRCGGCQLQMLPYAEQVRHKQQTLERLLAPFAPQQWSEPLLAEPWFYRHRARLGVGPDKQGKPCIGFKSAHSHAVVALDNCPVLDTRLQALLAQLPEWLAQLAHWQRLREIVIAVDTEGRIALTYQADPALPAADRECLRNLALAAGITLGGEDTLVYAVPGQALQLRFAPQDFTQVNPAINDQLVARCMEWLAPGPTDVVADYFCGLGNFSLALARRAGQVIGFEAVDAMVERAAANAARMRLANTRFEVADLFGAGVTVPAGVNKVLLDPPRAGARDLCRQLARAELDGLVYVSCNPQTLVRDLAVLGEGGFRVLRAGLVDMFPQTGHMEVVVMLGK